MVIISFYSLAPLYIKFLQLGSPIPNCVTICLRTVTAAESTRCPLALS